MDSIGRTIRRTIDLPGEVHAVRVTSSSSTASGSTVQSISTVGSGPTLVSESAWTSEASASSLIQVPTTAETATILPAKLRQNAKGKEIDPNGDVVAILPPTTVKLLISTKVLSIASPVFEQMFFCTGRNIQDLIEITFSNDSLVALEAVLCVLHLRHECVDTNIGKEVLYDIAVVAYKYSFETALGPWKEVWLKWGAGSGGRGLFVMHVFGDRDGFEKECRRMIVESIGLDDGDRGVKGKIEERGGGEEAEWGFGLLPDRVRDLITEVRVTLIESLLSVAEDFENLYCTPGIKCKLHTKIKNLSKGSQNVSACDLAILGSLGKHHFTIGIFPRPQFPYKGISVDGLAKSIKSLPCVVGWNKEHKDCSIVQDLVSRIDDVMGGLDKADIWGSTWGPENRGKDKEEERRWPISSRFALETVFLRYKAGKNTLG